MLLLYGCGMSDSNAHSPLNLPVLLLGGCAGQLAGGRHIRYEGDPLMPNLLVTLMDKLGVPVEELGKSDGRLSIGRLTGVQDLRPWKLSVPHVQQPSDLHRCVLYPIEPKLFLHADSQPRLPANALHFRIARQRRPATMR